jgi:hypothetical protein
MLVLSLLGAALLAFVLLDIAVTTLTMRGAGPLSSRVMQGMWRGLLAASPRGAHRLLAAGGTAIVVASALLWVVLLWAGWSLVFLGGGDAVVHTDSGRPAALWDTVYFAGFTLFTLGLGDFRPEGAVWQILTAVCVAKGLLALTMAVTYLMPVLSAAAGRRQLAAEIHCLGSTPDGILELCWNGSSFAGVGDVLNNLTPSIILQSQQHLAYPALNYFHSDDLKTSLPLRIAALDEALSILAHAVPSAASPDRLAVTRARSAIGCLLDALDAAHIEASADEPPLPAADRLGGRTLPALDLAALVEESIICRQRRRLLLAWVRNDGRLWEEVWEPLEDGSPGDR